MGWYELRSLCHFNQHTDTHTHKFSKGRGDGAKLAEIFFTRHFRLSISGLLSSLKREIPHHRLFVVFFNADAFRRVHVPAHEGRFIRCSWIIIPVVIPDIGLCIENVSGFLLFVVVAVVQRRHPWFPNGPCGCWFLCHLCKLVLFGMEGANDSRLTTSTVFGKNGS